MYKSSSDTITGAKIFSSSVAFNNTYTEARSSDSIGSNTTYNISWSSTPIYNVTLTTSTTFTYTGAKAGQTLTFFLSQDGTGNRTVTWPTTSWPSGTAPTLTTSTYKTDIISIFYDGAKYFGFIGGQNY
jgi:hypothetical protein